MQERNEPKRADFPARGVALGLIAGALVGLGQIQWYKLTGQWVKTPQIYPVFWSLIGLLAGLLVGLVWKIWKEPKSTNFVEFVTIGLMSRVLMGLLQIPWYALTGQPINHIGVSSFIWSLIGLIAGLMLGVFCNILKRRRA
jgi:hypothetical protein